ncbi:dynein light chain roadblock [Anaeramoeba flamelloides]|uniref:Dynein light chain roadblock n=1 Tax=Anaeramoeba flamelloides TaxID=1746091 RepID=A0AAV7ZIC3_9EUKA|nr:dynein light chain roadblock [Anaeramoeba flamelloides]KAJ6254758.1 dynein light chain roadblock [Anaeramoeba flamelloides]
MTNNEFEIEKQNKESYQAIEVTLKRVSTQPGFVGLVAITEKGQIIKSTFEEQEEAEKYALYLSHFIKQASNTVDALKEGDEVSFLRMRTKREEILMIPGDKYTLIVISDPNRIKERKF